MRGLKVRELPAVTEHFILSGKPPHRFTPFRSLSRIPRRLLLAVLLLFLIRTGGPWAARGILAMRPGPPDRPGAVIAGDFNLDGKIDLLQANFAAGDLSLFQEDPSGDYVERSPSPFVVMDGPTFLAVGDLNGDNRPDVVIVNRLGRGISIMLSDADRTFVAKPNLVVGRNPQAVAVADFNRDKRLDFAVTSEIDDVVYLFNGRGDGSFTFARLVDIRTPTQKTAKTSVGAYGIASGDFNRDGKLDLAVTQYQTDLLAILLGNGNGTFQTPVTIPVGRHPTYLATARLNDDLLPGDTDDFVDLVILLTGGKQNPDDPLEPPVPGGIVPLLGNGDGTFTPGAPLTESLADAPLQFARGRLRLGVPGFDDVVVVNFGTSTLALYPASGAGGFLPPTPLGGPASTLRSPNAVALADRDGDGFIDRIVATNYGVGICSGGTNSGVSCTSNLDCPLGSCKFSGGDSLTLFDGGGLNPFVEVPFSPVTATRNPVALAAGFLDSGSTSDMAVLSLGNSSLQTFDSMNNGFFFKRRQTPLPSGCGPTALALADFDRDGAADAAVAVTDLDGSVGPSTSPGFSILTGSGLGTFGVAVGTCSGGSSSGASCTADAGCPGGGSCSFSLSLGACQGGDNDGKACAADGDCPSGTCLLPSPPIPLAAPAASLLATDLNSLDADRDGVPNISDNCPTRYNPAQANTRGLTCVSGTNNGLPCTTNAQCPGGTCSGLDPRGDDCDSDSADPDGDQIVDVDDNCPDTYNPKQTDSDGNSVGDACDHDPDVTALEASLNQLEVFMRFLGGGGFDPPSTIQLGSAPDSLEIGSFTPGDRTLDLVATEPAAGGFQVLEGDGTGGFTPLTLVPLGGSPGAMAVVDTNPEDLDLDGVPNASDNCPTRYNPTQQDTDGDGAGDACSRVENPDGDTVVTLLAKRFDNCPDVYNFAQTDTDGDGIGDACDSNPLVYNPADDEDGDGVPNSTDNCPTRYNPNQENFNTDSVGDACAQATDPDGDLFNTASITRDNCPDTYNPDQQDTNADGIGDLCEDLPDLAIADSTANTLQIVIQCPPGQCPQGNWEPQTPLPVGIQPTAVTAVDLNGDGIKDLVVANTGSDTLSVFLGNGDGTFLSDPAFDVPVLPGPRTLQGGFFSRDAVLDFEEVTTLSPSLNTPVLAVNVISERADIDGSGRVNGRDLAFWARGFGFSRKDAGYPGSRDADINLDGKIDGLDLVFITTQFGKSVPRPAP